MANDHSPLTLPLAKNDRTSDEKKARLDQTSFIKETMICGVLSGRCTWNLHTTTWAGGIFVAAAVVTSFAWERDSVT